jgi:fatty acid desaturase
LISHADYIHTIRPLLPAAAFEPVPRRLLALAAHVLLVFAMAWLAGLTDSILAWLGIALVIGQSMACITFVAHDLMHGSIIRSRVLRYPIEVFAWTFMYMPASVWRKAHLAHHAHTQTMRDCDRFVVEAERSPATEAFKFTYPNQSNPLWNPVTLMHWAVYAAGNTMTAFLYGLTARPPDSSFVFAWQRKELLLVTFEVLAIAGVHLGLYFLMGGDWLRFLICDGLAFVVGSTIVTFYVYTNHSLRPLLHDNDPLMGTTTVHVPKFVAWLHSHFSLHTEHHLFPAMSSVFYPDVARALTEKYPERYNTMPYLEALAGCWKQPAFVSGELVGAAPPAAQSPTA